METKDRQLEENHLSMETKEKQLQQTLERLQISHKAVAKFQQTLQEKTISDLHHTISNYGREIRRLKKQSATVTIYQSQLKVPTAISASLVQKDINKMTWRKEWREPEAMERGAAVVHGNTAYFRPANSDG